LVRPTEFKSDEARAEYCRLYKEAMALSPVPVDEAAAGRAAGAVDEFDDVAPAAVDADGIASRTDARRCR
jgi:hypothetical protein